MVCDEPICTRTTILPNRNMSSLPGMQILAQEMFWPARYFLVSLVTIVTKNLLVEDKKFATFAPSEDRTHDLEIMRLTRYLLRHRGG